MAVAFNGTVHALNRRGRFGSGPQRDGHSVADDCADVVALMDLAGARFLFGYSYGGLVTLPATAAGVAARLRTRAVQGPPRRGDDPAPP
ncbi:hypothetical protein SAMN05444920_104123 [Nonomuraea solani]|uniref:Alpha/beta hydrolase fold n=2 Tax=Nonomuraea solani TaxID=1144553 RepID=A0A1H6CLI9_9ACTN|nr:hypothetical protein SAMN05444920_104123 [Nonomuraea solani]